MSNEVANVTLEVGHIARLKKEVDPANLTHDWEIFVKGTKEGRSLAIFIENIQFTLHQSFPDPVRIIRKPDSDGAYRVKESGYASFLLPITLTFVHGLKTEIKHDLILYNDRDISNSREHTLTFSNPVGEFRDALIKAGARMRIRSPRKSPPLLSHPPAIKKPRQEGQKRPHTKPEVVNTKEKEAKKAKKKKDKREEGKKIKDKKKKEIEDLFEPKEVEKKPPSLVFPQKDEKKREKPHKSSRNLEVPRPEKPKKKIKEKDLEREKPPKLNKEKKKDDSDRKVSIKHDAPKIKEPKKMSAVEKIPKAERKKERADERIKNPEKRKSERMSSAASLPDPKKLKKDKVEVKETDERKVERREKKRKREKERKEEKRDKSVASEDTTKGRILMTISRNDMTKKDKKKTTSLENIKRESDGIKREPDPIKRESDGVKRDSVCIKREPEPVKVKTEVRVSKPERLSNRRESDASKRELEQPTVKSVSVKREPVSHESEVSRRFVEKSDRKRKERREERLIKEKKLEVPSKDIQTVSPEDSSPATSALDHSSPGFSNSNKSPLTHSFADGNSPFHQSSNPSPAASEDDFPVSGSGSIQAPQPKVEVKPVQIKRRVVPESVDPVISDGPEESDSSISNSDSNSDNSSDSSDSDDSSDVSDLENINNTELKEIKEKIMHCLKSTDSTYDQVLAKIFNYVFLHEEKKCTFLESEYKFDLTSLEDRTKSKIKKYLSSSNLSFP